MTEVQNNKTERVIVLAHGVRSTAKGMINVRNGIYEDEDFSYPETAVSMFNYRYFPAVISGMPFITYFRNIRDTFADYFADYLKLKGEEYGSCCIDVIAHSFGSFLLCKALRNHPGVRVRKVILLGSVVDIDFNWPGFVDGRNVEEVYNFVGERDWVQWFSGMALTGMGTSGINGFKLTIPGRVENIYPDPAWDHLSYSKPDNVQKIIEKLK